MKEMETELERSPLWTYCYAASLDSSNRWEYVVDTFDAVQHVIHTRRIRVLPGKLLQAARQYRKTKVK